jgi:hypothetical protein
VACGDCGWLTEANYYYDTHNPRVLEPYCPVHARFVNPTDPSCELHSDNFIKYKETKERSVE